MWNRFSIKIQLILVMTFVVTIVEFSTLFFIHKVQQTDAQNNAVTEIKNISKSLNNDILKYILNPNADMLSDLTYKLSAFENITGFVLYDDAHKALFQHGKVTDLIKQKGSLREKSILFTQDHLLIKQDVSADNYVFGYALIEVDLSQYKEKQAYITSIYLSIFPVALLFALVLSLYLSKSYTKPFETILDAMKQSNPTKNKIVNITTSAKNEIEELFNGFNNQMQQINLSTQEINKLNQEAEETQREVVFRMGAIGETRSKETGNHVKRVAHYTKLFALYSGLSEYDAEMLKQASPMHDIGKVGIPDSILNKPGRFDADERRIMDTHAQLGYDMLEGSTRPLLRLAATVAYEHHEKWDGSGYPNQLKEEEISIAGRITAIADVFDALGSDRVYKKAWDDERIFNLFKEERAKHFDPSLVDIFFNHLDEFLAIRSQFKDI